MNSIEYKCETCGRTQRDLGILVRNLGTVCDDCYNRGIEWAIRQAAKEENSTTADQI